LDIESVKDPSSALPHKIPPMSVFASTLELHDIKPTDDIFFYDDFSVVGAARAYYLFSRFQVPSRICNFTLEKWGREGHPVERGAPSFNATVWSLEVVGR
jgi:thiosulfate/3-mercaptopyruvate sulfurtransferase